MKKLFKSKTTSSSSSSSFPTRTGGGGGEKQQKKRSSIFSSKKKKRESTSSSTAAAAAAAADSSSAIYNPHSDELTPAFPTKNSSLPTPARIHPFADSWEVDDDDTTQTTDTPLPPPPSRRRRPAPHSRTWDGTASAKLEDPFEEEETDSVKVQVDAEEAEELQTAQHQQHSKRSSFINPFAKKKPSPLPSSSSSSENEEEEKLGVRKHSTTNPSFEDSGTLSNSSSHNPFVKKTQTKPEDTDGASSNRYHDMASSSTETIQRILTYLEKKEQIDWDRGLHPGRAVLSFWSSQEEHEWDRMLRDTVECMEVEPQDVDIQTDGARIIYLIFNLKNKNHSLKEKQHRATSRPLNSRWWDVNSEYTEDKDDEEEDDDNISDAGERDKLVTDSIEAVLHAMEDFPDEEQLQEETAIALEAMTASSNKNNGKNGHTNGGGGMFPQSTIHRIVEEILVALEGFADNPGIVASGFGVLYNVSEQANHAAGGRSSLAANNPKLAKYALSSILHGMKEHRDDVELYTKGCTAIANLTQQSHFAQQLLICKEPLGLRIVSEGLKIKKHLNMYDNGQEWEENLVMRSAATSVLLNCSTHPSLEVKGKIVLGGGAAYSIDRFVDNLHRSSKDLDDTKNNTNYTDDRVVTMLVKNIEETLRIFENLANIESIVTKDNANHLHHNHSSISNPKSNNNGNTNNIKNNSMGLQDRTAADDIQKQLTKIVKPVLNIVRQYQYQLPTDYTETDDYLDRTKSIQYRALSTIERLTASHSNDIANDHGGISTLLNTLSATQLSSTGAIDVDDIHWDELIHDTVLACLSGLVAPKSDADDCDLLACFQNEDGVTTVFKCIRQKYQLQRELLEQAFQLLFYLSCRVRVILSTGDSTVIGTLGWNAGRALRNQFVQEENIFVLFGTINQYTASIDISTDEESELICHRGLGILVNIHAFIVALSSVQQQQKQRNRHTVDVFASDGGIRLGLYVMRKHGLVVAVQEYGIGLVASIMKSNPQSMCHKEFMDEEGINTILAAMMIHPKHGPIQLHAIDVLIYLLNSGTSNNQDSIMNNLGSTMTRIFVNPEYKRLIVDETNAVQIITDAIALHKSNTMIQNRGSTLLQLLSQTSSARASATSALSSSITSTLRQSQNMRASITQKFMSA